MYTSNLIFNCNITELILTQQAHPSIYILIIFTSLCFGPLLHSHSLRNKGVTNYSSSKFENIKLKVFTSIMPTSLSVKITIPSQQISYQLLLSGTRVASYSSSTNPILDQTTPSQSVDLHLTIPV